MVNQGSADAPSVGNDGGAAGDAQEATAGAPALEPVDCESEAVGPAPLRRLTRQEYARTARDLLGIEAVDIEAFPADPIAGGFDNNAESLSVSPLLAERFLESAEKLSAVADLSALLPCDAAKVGEGACAAQFVEQFGRRAYRHALQDGERERLLRAYAAGREGESFEAGIRLVIQTALQSPGFLYRLELSSDAKPEQGRVKLTPDEIAARLSYLLWGSMPSDDLFAAAAAGELATRDQIAAAARDMLADPRARPAITEFYRQWLGLQSLPSLSKDAELFPELDQSLRDAMGGEVTAFVEHVMWSAGHDLQTLLTAPLGSDPDEHSGVLTLPAVLAVHALPDQSSPVQRGKLVREKLLCQPLPAPPPNLNIAPPEVDPDTPTRERFAIHTADPACAACHRLMDPIGFVFEAYDALGRFRDTDAGSPIDTSGEISGSDDCDGPVDGAGELAERLAASRQVQDCVATQWFRFAVGRYESPADDCSLQRAQQAFADSNGDLLELLVALTQTDSFLYRPVTEAEAAP